MSQHECMMNPSNDDDLFTQLDKINHQLDGIPPSPSLIANRATTPSHPKAQSRTSNSKSNLQTPQKYTHTRQQDRWSTHGISTETGARESRDKPSENGAPKNSRSAKAPKDGVPPPVHDHNEARTNNPRLGGLTPRPKEKPKVGFRTCCDFARARSRVSFPRRIPDPTVVSQPVADLRPKMLLFPVAEKGRGRKNAVRAQSPRRRRAPTEREGGRGRAAEGRRGGEDGEEGGGDGASRLEDERAREEGVPEASPQKCR